MMRNRRFYEASMEGNITSLIELLGEDPLILDRVITSSSETPLHIAAMYGHIDFAKVLLNRKPDLTSELDSHGFSPLHLASSRKNVDMVKLLLLSDPDACSVTDQDGRTPLHLAALKGRIEAMKELIKSCPEAIQVVMDRGETILHLCVKHNRLESLKLLVESLAAGSDQVSSSTGGVSINSVDDYGNTILHLAVAKKNMEIIKFLLNNHSEIEVNALNNSGFTALDVLAQCARDLKDLEIGEYLRGAGIPRASEISGHALSNIPTKELSTTARGFNSYNNNKKKQKVPADDEQYAIWLKEKQTTLMVVASLLATMAFQAGVNPAGGVWQEDNMTKNPNEAAGSSIMASKFPAVYNVYMITTTIGFLSSLSIILLLISGLPYLKRKFLMWILTAILWVAITSVTITYMISMNNGAAYGIVSDFVIAISKCLWFGMIGLILLLHILRIMLHVILWLINLLSELNICRTRPRDSRISS